MPQRVPIMTSNTGTDFDRDSDTDEEIVVLSGGN